MGPINASTILNSTPLKVPLDQLLVFLQQGPRLKPSLQKALIFISTPRSYNVILNEGGPLCCDGDRQGRQTGTGQTKPDK